MPAVFRGLRDQQRVGAAVAERQGERGALSGLVPGNALGVDGHPIEEDGRAQAVHRLREGDLDVAPHRYGFLAIGERAAVERGVGNFGRRLGMKRHRIILAPKPDALAGADHPDAIGGIGL